MSKRDRSSRPGGDPADTEVIVDRLSPTDVARLRAWRVEGGYAQRFKDDLLRDIDRCRMSSAAKSRLGRWCHSRNGNEDAAALAREASRLLFGHVLERDG